MGPYPGEKRGPKNRHMPTKNPHPILLRPDNFTPRSRTPWGGTKIVSQLKVQALEHPNLTSTVGESWEISVEPDFPSKELTTSESLADIVAANPKAWLGKEAAKGRTNSALLVKLLDAADDLSVQIHPNDVYVGLRAGEAGKPEAWYVIDSEQGAGLYLGLAEGVTKDSMRAAINNGDDVSKLLNFVPVKQGDFFLIEAGTPHAIGRGVLLVEPQHVVPGKRGITYRFWDWNRKYDSHGALDPNGEPRALHVDHALAVTRWNTPRGEAFAPTIRVEAGEAKIFARPKIERFSGAKSPLPSNHLNISRVTGTGKIMLDPENAMRGVTVIAGRVEIDDGVEKVEVWGGTSAVIPACATTVTLDLHRSHAILSHIP